jgi:hypothetical protein
MRGSPSVRGRQIGHQIPGPAKGRGVTQRYMGTGFVPGRQQRARLGAMLFLTEKPTRFMAGPSLSDRGGDHTCGTFSSVASVGPITVPIGRGSMTRQASSCRSAAPSSDGIRTRRRSKHRVNTAIQSWSEIGAISKIAGRGRPKAWFWVVQTNWRTRPA